MWKQSEGSRKCHSALGGGGSNILLGWNMSHYLLKHILWSDSGLEEVRETMCFRAVDARLHGTPPLSPLMESVLEPALKTM